VPTNTPCRAPLALSLACQQYPGAASLAMQFTFFTLSQEGNMPNIPT